MSFRKNDLLDISPVSGLQPDQILPSCDRPAGNVAAVPSLFMMSWFEPTIDKQSNSPTRQIKDRKLDKAGIPEFKADCRARIEGIGIGHDETCPQSRRIRL